MKEWEGTELPLVSVKREQMGAFMCIARNNVPPAVSRRIVLNVHCKFKSRQVFWTSLMTIHLKETCLCLNPST